MKRRKPQNLTPPCSDGSTSSSGHSPSQASRHTPPRRPDPPSAMAAAQAAAAASAAGAQAADKRGLKRPLRPSPNGGGFQVEEQSGGKKVRLSNYVRPPDMQRYSNGYNSSSPRSEPGLSPRPVSGGTEIRANTVQASWRRGAVRTSTIQKSGPAYRRTVSVCLLL